MAVGQQVDDVGHGGRGPATTLVEELVESLRGVGEGVRGRRVVNSVALLQQQSAQPSVLTWKTQRHIREDT